MPASNALRTPAVAVIGCLDTKGGETDFLAREVRAGGVATVIYDCGVHSPRGCVPDVPRAAVAEAAGHTVEAIAGMSRGDAVAAMGRGLSVLLAQAWREAKVCAAVAAGGSGGTSIAAAGMAALPVGAGKLIVSTVASGDVRGYVGVRDLTLMHAVADIAGLNRITRTVLRNAGRAIAAMAAASPAPEGDGRPLVVASMFGVTTPAVDAARGRLEAEGCEVVVFHATGSGGRAMEGLIADGVVDGVLDLTITEWADEVVGGTLSAGPDRLRAAARSGVPQVVAPGALDMVNFGPPETVPERFRGRRLHRHNPQVTLMRTTPGENARIGKEVALRLNEAVGPVAVLLPLRGVSALDREGGDFWDPEADAAFRESARRALRPSVQLRALDLHNTDPAFAEAAADELLRMMREARTGARPGG